MNYIGDTFLVILEGDTLKFSGKIEQSEYDELSDFLLEVDDAVSGNEIVFDIDKLEYLNSSGIRMFAGFFLKTKKNIKIILRNDITWQRVGISPLTKIKPEGKIVSIEK